MMRGTRFGSLGLALILVIPAVRAEEDGWRAVPVGGAKSGVAASPASTGPGVSLDRPRPLTNDSFSAPASGVRPASYSESLPPTQVIRGQSADSPAPALKKPSVWGEPVGPLPPGTVVSDSV